MYLYSEHVYPHHQNVQFHLSAGAFALPLVSALLLVLGYGRVPYIVCKASVKDILCLDSPHECLEVSSVPRTG